MATTAAEVRPLTERPPTAAAAGDSPAPVHASTASKRPLPHAPSALPPAKKPKTRTQYTHLRDALAKANPGLKGPELTALVREASAYAKSAAKSAARAAAGSREEQWLALWAEAATSADADLKAVKAFEVEHASTLARALRERLGAAIQQAADEKSLFGALEAAIAACARALDPATPEAERVDVSVLASVPADRTTSAKDLGAELKNELQTACSVLDEIKRECAAGELRAVLRTLGAADGDARTSLDEALCAADELRARYGKLLTKAGADATGVVELAKLVDELDAEAARVSDMRDALGLSTAGRATLVAHARSVRELRKELAETRAKLAVAQKFMDEENAKRDALKRCARRCTLRGWLRELRACACVRPVATLARARHACARTHSWTAPPPFRRGCPQCQGQGRGGGARAGELAGARGAGQADHQTPV